MNSSVDVLLAKKAQTPEEIVELFLSLIVVWCGWKLAEYAYGLLPAWWLRNERQVTESELVTQFPKKAWVAFSFRICSASSFSHPWLSLHSLRRQRAR